MMAWEYRVIPIRMSATDSLLEELNSLGKGGWELVHVMPCLTVLALFLKRPVEAAADGTYREVPR
jgi:hypothetical protein